MVLGVVREGEQASLLLRRVSPEREKARVARGLAASKGQGAQAGAEGWRPFGLKS